jgi:hypothetical protein
MSDFAVSLAADGVGCAHAAGGGGVEVAANAAPPGNGREGRPASGDSLMSVTSVCIEYIFEILSYNTIFIE